MSLFARISSAFSPSPSVAAAPVATAKPAAKPWETGPLKPLFDRSKSPFLSNIRQAQSESESLGKGFYASKIEMSAANIDATPIFYGYHTDKPMSMAINQALPNDRLDLSVFMNVSGHDWREDTSMPMAEKQKLLQERADGNSYNIKVTRPDGSSEMMTGILAKGALSTGQDISITNMKPGKYILEGWPDHSAAVGGYVEGRRVEINYAPGGDRFE
jgi:hypothetical protein